MASQVLLQARLFRASPGQLTRFARHYSAPANNSIPAAKKKYVPTSGTYPQGFDASGTIVGVKPGNTTKPDLALISSHLPCSAAAVFTKNKFQAAPVTFSRDLLKKKSNHGIRSVLINSGCANAVTGKGGLEDAKLMAGEADKSLGSHEATVVMSTGVIGQRLPIQKIVDNVPAAFERLGSSHDHWLACAKAICTTDTFPKLRSRTFTLPSSGSTEYRIAGMTKGAGMIHPNMATLLGHAVNRSFNSITIDGDTSTNDTVAFFANGAAGGSDILIVRDGEGATKFVTIRVAEAASEDAARRVASTIARSPLVKTALYGKDANWGRILCATGYSLISEPGHDVTAVDEIVPETTNVSFIPTDGSAELKLLVDGEPRTLGTGKEQATYWTCDYSHEYITINGDYRT
ncbi:unnamed protein product [Parascedosporium putredinis]|uniref:Arginine biosynthesis bifunctional protein ArgJ, mitochondrial n=1 Tax=Parascedosporium putredinis TaxID=1442378 RepID=A0A9P1GUG0_9PEZI|nr:unnamed protein product [Parascedosporium putredinis]CAI7987546.1 unnamed protein product [Parascedosporium putredinis]